MQIDWWTLGLQALNFLILVWLLWRFLYRPVRTIIGQRKELAERAFSEADREKKAAEASRRQLEEELSRQTDERQKLLNAAHQQIEGERIGLIEEARGEARHLIEAARKTIASERRTALAELHDEVADLAADLASELLRGASTRLSDEVALEQLVTQLKSLPPEELDRLRSDLGAADTNLVVVTAAPLNTEEQTRWRQRLAVCLEHPDKTSFASDPEIIGGAELQLPHTVMRFTWDSQLRKAKELLRRNETTS